MLKINVIQVKKNQQQQKKNLKYNNNTGSSYKYNLPVVMKDVINDLCEVIV